MDATQSLATISTFRRALAKAESLSEVKDLRDKAAAAKHYFKAASMGTAAVNSAVECKLLAERKAGAMLSCDVSFGRGKKSVIVTDLGIDHSQSKRWQRIASVPDDIFTAHIAGWKEANKELTTASVLRLASEPKPKQKQWSMIQCVEKLRSCIETIYDRCKSVERSNLAAQLRSIADEIESGKFVTDG